MKTGVAFLKLHPRITILVVLLILGASITIAQRADPPPQPAALFPEGALVYVEAQDLESLLQWWKSSKVKADWEASANYEQFQNSRLYLKLKDRLKKWGSGGDFSFHLNNLIQAAGSHTGVALYDIGELKAIAATRLPFTKAKSTEIWMAKSRFQEKTTGNQTYYVEPRQGALVFAYVDPYLIVATEETLLTKTLSNFSARSQTLEQSHKWQRFPNKTESDVSLFLDQEALQRNRHFQKYWIHRNVRDFASIEAVWIQLTVEPNAIVEQRYFSRTANSGAEGQNVRTYVEPFRQFRHEALYMEAPITSAAAAHHIVKMVNRLPEKDKTTSYPSPFSGAADRATMAETRNILLEQIDEPIAQVKAETLLRATQEELIAKALDAADPAAQVRLSYPLWDNQALFVRFPESLLIHLKNFSRLEQQKFLDQILEHFLLLHSTLDQGGRWQSEGNGIFVLQSFRPLYVKFQDPWILLSTEEPDFRQLTSRLPAPTTIPTGSYGEVNWKNGRWKYTRLMQRLDHGAYSDDVPLLFSENIGSLLNALDPIVASSVTQNENEEVVRYELD